ncbi:hypothetical protein TURU_015723 [Turdus rufiventris]|nr:hypothetical protein TURU_015723 [Turdus rufiventris]
MSRRCGSSLAHTVLLAELAAAYSGLSCDAMAFIVISHYAIQKAFASLAVAVLAGSAFPGQSCPLLFPEFYGDPVGYFPCQATLSKPGQNQIVA